jgi:hypothetical protein
MARSHRENSGRVRSPDSGPRRERHIWRCPFPDAEATLPPKRDPGKSRMAEAEVHALPAGRSVRKFPRPRHLSILMLSNPPLQQAGGGVATDVRFGVDVQKPPRNRRVQVILTSSVAGRPFAAHFGFGSGSSPNVPWRPLWTTAQSRIGQPGLRHHSIRLSPFGLPNAEAQASPPPMAVAFSSHFRLPHHPGRETTYSRRL